MGVAAVSLNKTANALTQAVNLQFNRAEARTVQRLKNGVKKFVKGMENDLDVLEKENIKAETVTNPCDKKIDRAVGRVRSTLEAENDQLRSKIKELSERIAASGNATNATNSSNATTPSSV